MRDIKYGNSRKVRLLSLLRAELYRLWRGNAMRAAAVLTFAFLACALPLFALRGMTSERAADALSLLRSVLLPALPFAAALLCPFLVEERSLRAKVTAGAGRGIALCACAGACTACLLALYTAAYLCALLYGVWQGFGSAGVSACLLSYLCGAVLCTSCSAFDAALCCAVGERSLALLLCLVAALLGYALAGGIQQLAALCVSQGVGAPVLPLLLQLLPLLLPQGAVAALQRGASAYPLYILLAALFSVLCLRVGVACFRRRTFGGL